MEGKVEDLVCVRVCVCVRGAGRPEGAVAPRHRHSQLACVAGPITKVGVAEDGCEDRWRAAPWLEELMCPQVWCYL